MNDYDPIVNLLIEDKELITYRKSFRKIAGSVTATILLQQMMFRGKGREDFYKFKEPCKHKLYKPGDSWTEELGFSSKEFDSAIKKIGTKITKGVSKFDALKKVDPTGIVIYWTDAKRITWYQLNWDLLGNLLKGIYLVNNQREVTGNLTKGDLPLVPETTTETTTENQKSPNGGDDDFTDLFPTDSEPTQQPQSSNGKPDMQNLTEADKAHLQTFGFLPDKKPLTYDIRQELLQAGWIITITNVEKVIALYILLVRKHRPSFAIPNDISIRKDWHKAIQGHLQDYALDDLPKLYKKALARLDDGKLTYTRPGSLTKILADVASEEPAKGINFDKKARKGLVAAY